MVFGSFSSSSSLLLALPDDIFGIVSRTLTPRDVCNLSLCCKTLYSLASSDKIWLTQCNVLDIIPQRDLFEWRKGISSYKSLCRFLLNIHPLIGVWVHQNPELGNVVYVIPGFISVIGCRIIPQELGPLGLEDGPILWAPVFEIVGDVDGSAKFFLHGKDKEFDYIYPGSLKSIDRTCNVLLLEVEPKQQKDSGKLVHSKSFAYNPNKELSVRICRSDSEISKSQRVVKQNASKIPFNKLSFGDRRKLLEIVTSQIRLKVPDSANSLLLCTVNGCGDDDEKFHQDMVVLNERRLILMQMYNEINGTLDLNDIRKSLDRSSGIRASSVNGGDEGNNKKKTLAGHFRDSLKQIFVKSNSSISNNNNRQNSSNKHAQVQEFLTGDTIGLTLHASSIKLSFYRAWPNMHDTQFALYKLPMWAPTVDQEYAGLWGGTFGWPPGKPSEEKPGKALFFLLLSYEESQGKKLLIGTKILEGTHYVLHPNGSAMFIVNVNEPSLDPFPWDADVDSFPLDVKCGFNGEGIANGYGFRYPGSRPGSLYVIQDEVLAFIWKESKAVLTLQRVNLVELLKKGERVPALPPIPNFSYLTKSYSNVFAGFANTSNGLSSPRAI